jgi:WD40 repeat protein
MGKDFKAWDVETGALIHSFEKLGKRASPVAFSSDKRNYVTGEGVRPWPLASLTIWDLLTSKAVQGLDRGLDGRSPYRISFSPNGKQIALAGQDRLLQVWDLDSAKMVWNLTIRDEILRNLN